MSAVAQTRLWETDSYVSDCTARVLDIRGSYVILDRTALVPSFADMEGDAGWIGGAAVTNSVFMERGHVAAHAVETVAGLRSRETVHVAVDHFRRIGLLKNATATDLVVGVLWSRPEPPDLVGAEITADGSSLTLGSPCNLPIIGLERVVNELISRALPVRLGPPGAHHRRLCHVPGLPPVVGYGPRVAKTSEVGLVRLTAAPASDSALRIDCSIRAGSTRPGA